MISLEFQQLVQILAVDKKAVVTKSVPIAIPLHAPETKSTFLPLLHDYFHYL